MFCVIYVFGKKKKIKEERKKKREGQRDRRGITVLKSNKVGRGCAKKRESETENTQPKEKRLCTTMCSYVACESDVVSLPSW